jgi:hypothetical protein
MQPLQHKEKSVRLDVTDCRLSQSTLLETQGQRLGQRDDARLRPQERHIRLVPGRDNGR